MPTKLLLDKMPKSQSHDTDRHDMTDMLAKKYDEYYNSMKLRAIHRVKGDGHCLIYSVINCMLEYKENHYRYMTIEVIHELKNEIKKNWSRYCNFLPGGGTCQNFDRDARPIFWV